jgi:flagellar assembly protein FliH
MNIWTDSQATSFGSFAIDRVAPVFTPWGSEAGTQEAAPMLDLEAIQAEAFAQGFEQGRRSVELEVEGEREVLARLAEGLEVLRLRKQMRWPCCLRKRWTASFARSSARWTWMAPC